jgi:hypothetical protein
VSEKCKATFLGDGGWHNVPCSRWAVKDGYCKQHHPDAVAARREASRKRDEERWNNSPDVRLRRAEKQLVAADEIVRAVAKMDPEGVDGDEWPVCKFCNNSWQTPMLHTPHCLYLRAQQYIVDYPGEAS